MPELLTKTHEHRLLTPAEHLGQLTNNASEAPRKTYETPARFPIFSDVELVSCLDNFELRRQGDGDYLMSWWGDASQDVVNMLERSPTLAAALQESETGSPFSFLYQKLKAFGLCPLDTYLFQQRGSIVELSRHFGGKDYKAFEGRIGFAVRICRHTAEVVYDQIIHSQCAEEMPLPYWRFRWHDLPGGPEATFVVYRRATRKDGFGEPLTNARMRRIFYEAYPSLRQDVERPQQALEPAQENADSTRQNAGLSRQNTKQPELQLCFDAALKQAFIVSSEEFGRSVRLDPEVYEVRHY